MNQSVVGSGSDATQPELPQSFSILDGEDQVTIGQDAVTLFEKTRLGTRRTQLGYHEINHIDYSEGDEADEIVLRSAVKNAIRIGPIAKEDGKRCYEIISQLYSKK